MALPELTAENAYVFRITHRDNLPWILDNGLHCRSSGKQDPNFVNIGLVDLIDKRKTLKVNVPPGGTLSDYVPFYFTPRSIMALNINSGRNVPKRANSEIIILCGSLNKLAKLQIPFLITDKHACAIGTKFSSDMQHLSNLDWGILQRSDFSRDNDDPDKTNRYQAEALIRSSMPIDALLGIACCDASQKAWVDQQISSRGLQLQTTIQRGWYF